MPRYLFGPVTPAFARDKLALPRAASDGLAFDPAGETDLRFGADDSWAAVAARFPPGWEPDFIALWGAYAVVPPGVWAAPVPVVLLAGDWNLLWHQYRELTPRCELILADAAGVEAFAAAGPAPAHQALLYGGGLSDLDPAPAGPRDIDVLFVGNLNPAVQAERMPWLGRLARLPGRRVVIRTGVYGAEYRALLRRAKIVFNRSVRGECNQRVFEAAGAGAVVFQEAGNREVPAVFADGRECVSYTDATLESLFGHYLDHEPERAAVAAAARAKADGFRCDRLLPAAFDRLDLAALRARRADRPPPPDAAARGAELLSQPPARWADPALTAPLRAAPPAPLTDYLLGLVSPAAEAVGLFRRARAADPGWVPAALALAEATAATGPVANAVALARAALDGLDAGSTGRTGLAHAASSYPPRFDEFRVEWERAGWGNAGDRAGEDRAKLSLLRWRLHDRLAAWTGDPGHAEAALAARPDSPTAHAQLGALLLRAGRAADAVPHLRRAAAADPFNPGLAGLLIDALARSGDGPAAAAR
ncbi:MAG TPA: glycosyltransferase, partial [Urbifossiella sp.]|nr:glycosyltransferase [Urbifossiella sp.]